MKLAILSIVARLALATVDQAEDALANQDVDQAEDALDFFRDEMHAGEQIDEDALEYFEEYERMLSLDPESVSAPNYKPARVLAKPGTVAEAKYYALYAGLAYCPGDTVRRWDCKHCGNLGAKVVNATFVDPVRKTRSLLVLDHAKQAIVLTFRGTSNLRNWVENARVCKKTFVFGTVHSGFWDCADDQMTLFMAPVKKLLDDYPSYTLVLTGHSLGGALATLSAVLLQRMYDVDVGRMHLVTYGQPRVGDFDLVSWINMQEWKVTRVVNANDLVPHLPLNAMGYFHSHTQVYINQRKSTVCSIGSIEDSLCSNSNMLFSVQAHRSVFDIQLGADGC